MASSLHTEITINAPKERIWEILTDFSAYETWNPFIIKSSGEAREGARLVNVMKNGDKTMTFRPVILTVTPNRFFEWRGVLFLGVLFAGRHYFELQDTEDGRVRLIHGEHFSGILSGAVMKKIGEETRNNFIRMNEAVKARAEGGERV